MFFLAPRIMFSIPVVSQSFQSVNQVLSSPSNRITHRAAVAPMMDYTDRFFRYLMRLISRHSLLYTEMIHCAALINGDRDRLLEYDPAEHPLALQLGGNNPDELAACTRMAADWGYDQVNLNLGCPSERVQSGRFGACLMAEPELVADCLRAMIGVGDLPVTVKTRIGIDHQDSYPELTHFVATLAEAGCRTFIIHARKAWLQGLSPRENREIPPLRYDVVYRLKQDFPHLEIWINGGIRSLEEAARHLRHVDGFMIGRAAYEDPWLFSQVDSQFYHWRGVPMTRFAVLADYLVFLERERRRGTPLHLMTKHLITLFYGQPGAREWRRFLSDISQRQDIGPERILKAAENLRRVDTC